MTAVLSAPETVDHRATSGTPVTAVVSRAVAPYAAVHRSRDFLVTGGSDRSTSVPKHTLVEVVGGLISSACRRSHAAAPVRITVGDVAGGIEVSVQDESNGFDPEMLAELLGPSRLPRLIDDAAVRVAWTAREAGALVDVASTPEAGARVTVTLPLPS